MQLSRLNNLANAVLEKEKKHKLTIDSSRKSLSKASQEYQLEVMKLQNERDKAAFDKDPAGFADFISYTPALSAGVESLLFALRLVIEKKRSEKKLFSFLFKNKQDLGINNALVFLNFSKAKIWASNISADENLKRLDYLLKLCEVPKQEKKEYEKAYDRVRNICSHFLGEAQLREEAKYEIKLKAIKNITNKNKGG